METLTPKESIKTPSHLSNHAMLHHSVLSWHVGCLGWAKLKALTSFANLLSQLNTFVHIRSKRDKQV